MPTPLNGWRAFWGEVGVIVLGVLIALAAQQAVERFSDRERADSAIRAIRAEVADHDFTASEIELVRPCILAQLDRLQASLLSGSGQLAPLYKESGFSGDYVIRLPDRVWSSATWDNINDSDVLRRIEPELVATLGVHYSQIDLQREMNVSTIADQTHLTTLAILSPREELSRLAYIDTIQRMRSRIGSLDLVAGQLRDSLARAGMLMSDSERNATLATSGTIKFCRRQGLPLGKLRPADGTAT